MYLLLFVAGIFAGFVNTVAGAGSALTVPAFMLTGLDAAAANASNRVAVVVQTVAGSAAFHCRGVRPWAECRPVLPILLLGSVLGALCATRLSPASMQSAFGGLFVVLAALLGFKPRWLNPPPQGVGDAALPNVRGLPTQGLFLAAGFYGGFIQAGVGIPLLLLLVRRLGLDVVRGNAAKTALTMTFTIAALIVFQNEGRVNWPCGLATACGSLIGSLIGVEAAVRLGAELIRRAVIVGLLLAAARTFGWI